MTPAKRVKEAGLKSLKQVGILTGVQPRTLDTWFHKKRALFEIIVLGCKAKLEADKAE